MAEKRYYWLKLHKDFFKRHEIRIIEDMPNGKDYILFYLKLLVESVTHEGNLRFSDTIPYNEQMLATITNTNVDVVKTAMKIFVELNMIEILDDQTVYMTDVNEMIGSETDWAVKKRLQRAKKDNVPQLSQNCPIENRDKRKDIRDKSIENIDKNNSSKDSKRVFGKYKNVRLTEEEYNKLVEDKLDYMIETLSEGKELKGYTYKSDYLAVRSWAKREKPKTEKQTKLKSKASYDIEKIAREAKLNDNFDI